MLFLDNYFCHKKQTFNWSLDDTVNYQLHGQRLGLHSPQRSRTPEHLRRIVSGCHEWGFVSKGGADRFWWGWNKISECTGRQSSQTSQSTERCGKWRLIVVDFHFHRLRSQARRKHCEGQLRNTEGIGDHAYVGKSNLASDTMPRKFSLQTTLRRRPTRISTGSHPYRRVAPSIVRKKGESANCVDYSQPIGVFGEGHPFFAERDLPARLVGREAKKEKNSCERLLSSPDIASK